MIFEVRTYDLVPNAVVEVERRLAAALEARLRISPLLASFHGEIGAPNQVIQIWPYRDLAERDVVGAAAAEVGWPPAIEDLVVDERADVFVPLPIARANDPGPLGPFFEMRCYVYAGDAELPALTRAWEAALPGRLAYGPLIGPWRSVVGGIHRLLNIWPYRSLDERIEVRRKAVEAGVWPPHAVAARLGLPAYRLLHQENKVVMAAPFSPLQ